MGVTSIGVSHGWWDTFRWRHPELLRTGEAIAYSWELHACIMWLSRHFDIVALKFIVFVH